MAAMSRYDNVKFIFISPDELRLPEYLKEDILDPKNIEYVRDNGSGRCYAAAGHPLHDESPEGEILQ